MISFRKISVLQDDTVLELLEEGAMFTLGSESQYPDWEAMWKQELSRDNTNRPKGLQAFICFKLKICAGNILHSAAACCAGWTAHIEVQASVVTLRNVAHADDFGLLNPILHRYMKGACSLKVGPATVPGETTVWPCGFATGSSNMST